MSETTKNGELKEGRCIYGISDYIGEGTQLGK